MQCYEFITRNTAILDNLLIAVKKK